jgi:hypothetical protein
MLDPAGLSYVDMPVRRVTSKASALNLRTRVCKGCNNGWMSRLEEQAKRLVVAMATSARTDTPMTFTADEARMIGIWAQKTAITNELTSPYQAVTTAAMRQRLRQGAPLRASLVWAARHPEDYLLSFGSARLWIGSTPTPAKGEAGRYVLLTSITFRYLTLLVLITDGQVLPPRLDITRWDLMWPVSGEISFPPPVAATGSEVTKRITNHEDWLPFSDVKRPWRLNG